MKILTKLITTLGSLALIAAVLWLGWQYLGPVRPEISELRRQAALKLIPQLVEDIRKNRGEVKTVLFIPLANDSSAFVSTTLRRKIELSGVLNLGSQDTLTRGRLLLNLPLVAADNVEQALALAKQSTAQAALFGRIDAFEEREDGAVLSLQLSLISLPDGRVLWTQAYTSHKSAGFMQLAESTAATRGSTSFFTRLLAWALLVLLLPIFTIQFLRLMLRKGSNSVNATMLALYTGIDAILAVLLLTGAPFTSVALSLVFLATITAAFLYNVRIMTFALKMDSN
ncbi:MAG: hypothetical protein Q4G66_12990 [bacterium]|nr:hypothetical protein [bacterium]